MRVWDHSLFLYHDAVIAGIYLYSEFLVVADDEDDDAAVESEKEADHPSMTTMPRYVQH